MAEKIVMKMEKSLIKTALYTLLFLIVVEIIAYFGFFRGIQGFFSKFGYYIIFLVISIFINSIAIWHIKAYDHMYTHMTGMMIGMTIGMTSGFSIGLITGATNGMFIGSLAGVIIGMMAGGYSGYCCGIMGLMEGMMAGLMGGVMGPMTSVMTINDNVKILMLLLTLAIITIISGLIYLIYKEESMHMDDVKYKGFDFLPFITVNFIITIALTFLMVFGPKSFLFVQ